MEDKHISVIFEKLGRMEGKQDQILHHQKDHSTRLSTVEKRQNHLMGWGAGVVAVFSFIGAVFKMGA